MIEIDNKIVGLDVFEKAFVCDLNACKGACCVAGDSGAPLTHEELEILDTEIDAIKPFLRDEGLREIEKHGVGVIDNDGDLVTPLVNNQECAFVFFANDGKALCGIEAAWKAGATTFRKPVSCHLYPIRITSYPSFDAVNYDKWEICDPACQLGESLKVPVFRFAKDALIRKYDDAFYQKLEAAAALLERP